MEYQRTATHQWIDADLYQVLNRLHGTPEKFANVGMPDHGCVGTLAEALAYVRDLHPLWAERCIIVRLHAIVAFPLADNA